MGTTVAEAMRGGVRVVEKEAIDGGKVGIIEASFVSAVLSRFGRWKQSVRIGGWRWLLQTEFFWTFTKAGGQVETKQTLPEIHLFTHLLTAFAPKQSGKRSNQIEPK
ncbi:hypothetical protein KSP40_PGU001482 [Platanthera guangdongensis]|uniref:Uncharacterized protein n=1 Tax=Platanthera guangdongensis TaxID=2320717 RepID=A0ABR2LLQ2_9ASPA